VSPALCGENRFAAFSLVSDCCFPHAKGQRLRQCRSRRAPAVCPPRRSLAGFGCRQSSDRTTASTSGGGARRVIAMATKHSPGSTGIVGPADDPGRPKSAGRSLDSRRGATIAFLSESNRHDRHGAGDPYGDDPCVRSRSPWPAPTCAFLVRLAASGLARSANRLVGSPPLVGAARAPSRTLASRKATADPARGSALPFVAIRSRRWRGRDDYAIRGIRSRCARSP
jgi:hypothetical protein